MKIFLPALLSVLLAASNFFGQEKKSKEAEMKIAVRIENSKGSHQFSATLSENKSAKAFADLLKKGAVTVKMNDYGGFEKVGPLGTSLPRSDERITTSAGDIILYQGNQITIYYDKNSWNFTRLGKLDGVDSAGLKKILGDGGVTARFSLE